MAKLKRRADYIKPEDLEEGENVTESQPTDSGFTDRANPDVAAAARELAMEMEQQRLDKLAWDKEQKLLNAEKLARLTVDMPASKHKLFKARVASEDKNLTKLVNRWVDEYMEGNKK